jgi:MSHA biogenesis protein MshK
MAERLMLVLALFAAALPGFAQGLSDPTRPPSANAAAADAAPEAPGAQLQSVLISPHRRLAVINGQTVSVGAKVGDATLVRIAETSVVLKRGDTLETLPLLPGLEKKTSTKARVRGKP